MTTIKNRLLLFALLIFPMMPISAQEKKLFTLEDLNFGGYNYRNMQPQNKWLTWWGDELIRTDVEECYVIDKKTGRETLLFTLDEQVGRQQRGGEPLRSPPHERHLPLP